MALRNSMTACRKGNTQLQFLGTAVIIGMMMTSCVLQNFDEKSHEDKTADNKDNKEHHSFWMSYHHSYSDDSVKHISVISLPKF